MLSNNMCLIVRAVVHSAKNKLEWLLNFQQVRASVVKMTMRHLHGTCC